MIKVVVVFTSIVILLSSSITAFYFNNVKSNNSKSTKLSGRAVKNQQLGTFEHLIRENGTNTPKVTLFDCSNDLLPYRRVWDFQKHYLSSILLNDDTTTTTVVPDCLILLQHTPVYTLGSAADEADILINGSRNSNNVVDIVQIERGGEVTYHGPGQLTGYPILDLKSNYKCDIHWYMRALEEVVLLSLQLCGIHDAYREEGITGVWVQNKKVAAFGVKCRRWVTMHGFAVNVEQRSLDHFRGIIPCGLEGRMVGCLNDFLDDDHQLTCEQFASYLKEAFIHIFGAKLDDSEPIPDGLKFY